MVNKICIRKSCCARSLLVSVCLDVIVFCSRFLVLDALAILAEAAGPFKPTTAPMTAPSVIFAKTSCRACGSSKANVRTVKLHDLSVAETSKLSSITNIVVPVELSNCVVVRYLEDGIQPEPQTLLPPIVLGFVREPRWRTSSRPSPVFISLPGRGPAADCPLCHRDCGRKPKCFRRHSTSTSSSG